jgi:hypothetical protein
MDTGNRPQGMPSPAIVFETLMAYQRTAALCTAIQLNRFRGIGGGPGAIASLAKRCGASERCTHIQCDHLAAIGSLSKEVEAHRHTPASALFLDLRFSRMSCDHGQVFEYARDDRAV